MAGNTVVLLPAASVARHLGWWCPAADLLGRIGPGCEVKLRAGIAEEDGEVAVERTRAVWLSVDRIEERLLYGTVRESSFDNDGYCGRHHIHGEVDRQLDDVYQDSQ